MSKGNRKSSRSEEIGPLINAIVKSKNEEIAQLEATLTTASDDLAYKTRVLNQKEAELTYVQASKFWKIRNLYVRLRLNKLHPKNLMSSILSRKEPVRQETHVEPAPTGHRPKVSIIVPNYNHAAYLRQRLDSIYAQTYDNYEVILLDDNSSDESRDILQEYKEKHSDNTTFIFNKKNGGNVFKQWKKGVERANGDLLWIAESDDYCDADFLEKLIGSFKDESVMLTYARPVFVNEDGKKADYSFETHVQSLSAEKWMTSYIETAHNEVRQALGIKNTIPNVSGVLFRNVPTDQFDYEALTHFKVCGDWYFYLSIIRGGRLSYVGGTNNYYRLHPGGTATNYLREVGYIQEHVAIAEHILRNYDVDMSVIAKQRQAVREVWNAQRPGEEQLFDNNYRLHELEAVGQERKPNILVGIYGFTTGGGETVPINLANALKRDGYGVTLYVFNPDTERTTRKMLLPTIPIIDKGSIHTDSLLKNFDIELIHTHYPLVEALFAERTNKHIPHVATTHGMYDALSVEEMNEVRPHLQGVNHWVYVAEKNRKVLLESFRWLKPEQLTKISNGFTPAVNVEIPSRRELGIGKNDFVLCLASRSVITKGWFEAIDAVKIANLVSSRRIVLLLIGDGPVYNRLRDTNMHHSDDILLLGFRQNVYGYFTISDMGLLPTTFTGESCPMVIAESLAAHIPFIGTDVGDIRAMLQLEDGRVAGEVIPLHDGTVHIHELALSIARFANDGKCYETAKKASIQRSEDFTLATVAAKHETLYAKLLS